MIEFAIEVNMINIPKVPKNKISIAIMSVVGVFVLYILAVGIISSPVAKPYSPETLEANATDKERALVISEGVTFALENQLDSLFGFLPNDLITPLFIDNVTNFQKGVIYATRPASDIIAKNIGRFGTRDTIDQRLADATSRFFSYSEDVWGFLFIYDAEGKYRQGIKNWKTWANAVGASGKQAAIYNMKSDDVYNVIKYCVQMTDYALGVLNNELGHTSTDDAIYFAKGISAVTANVFRALIAADSTIVSRGGEENIKEALNRFMLIDEFNPIYVMAGGNASGDAMLPNHVAALARHLDVANNRLTDVLTALAR